MKLVSLLLLTFLTSSHLYANDFSSIIRKVEQKILYLDEEMNRPDQVIQSIPWHVLDERETAFWKSVLEAYDYLQRTNLNARYAFMLGAVQASSEGRNQDQKVNSLKNWIKRENLRIYTLGLKNSFYVEWKNKVKNINNSISEIESSRPIVAIKSDARGTILDTKNFLSELKDDLKLANKKPEIQPLEKSPIVKPEVVSDSLIFSSAHYIAIILTALGSLLAGLLYPRKKKVIVKKVTKTIREVLPPLPVEEMTSSPAMNAPTEELSPAPFNVEGVNIEEECKKILEDNNYLLGLSSLKVQPGIRSPFKTTINSSSEKVAEALQWLLKGTIAVVNTSGGKVSHMEWNCKEQNGRVSVEFILHGIEVDFKSLYLNTLMDGSGSATAHFGRSEMTLDGHLPVVGFKCGNRKTTVSLGLDSYTGQLNH